MDFSKQPHIDVNSLFGGSLQHVPGVGYVNAPANNVAGALGDDASVMMIGGLGDGLDAQGRMSSAVIDRSAQTLSMMLTQPVKIGPVTQPLWVWLLGALGITGLAGWYFFAKRK